MRVVTSVLAVALWTSGARAQGFLEEFSYEGLGFSGIGLDVGAVGSDRITTEVVGGVRIDYGMFAPRVRVVFGASYFRGQLEPQEIADFETRLQGIVVDPTGIASVSVGEVTWANVEVTADLQYLFPGGGRYTTYLGLGIGAHVTDADGDAIADTFVEDALDTITAGVNALVGFEAAVTDRIHVLLEGRGGLTSELLLGSVRFGVMYLVLGGGGS